MQNLAGVYGHRRDCACLLAVPALKNAEFGRKRQNGDLCLKVQMGRKSLITHVDVFNDIGISKVVLEGSVFFKKFLMRLGMPQAILLIMATPSCGF
jgi:hypothetical protein